MHEGDQLTGTRGTDIEGVVGFIFSFRDPLLICLARGFTQDRYKKPNFLTK